MSHMHSEDFDDFLPSDMEIVEQQKKKQKKKLAKKKSK